jgi:aspartate/methionine/tyrosine aminotransferase
MVPDAATAEALITDRTRAIVLVSPNNPTGAEYPAATLTAFRDLARAHDLALIVDETYRDFHAAPPGSRLHDLFMDAAWDDTVIGLYSFSKAYRLTGHRVGAAIASPRVLAEVEKYLDTVAICANQLAQRAALWGMENLSDWLAGERREILTRRTAIDDGFPQLAARGWQLLGAGAYFAYMQHPFDEASDTLAQRMVDEIGVLCLPGTMFMPDTHMLDGARQVRIAFANIDAAGIAALYRRLAALD